MFYGILYHKSRESGCRREVNLCRSVFFDLLLQSYERLRHDRSQIPRAAEAQSDVVVLLTGLRHPFVNEIVGSCKEQMKYRPSFSLNVHR